jgi:hypothetical protein
VLRRLSQYQGRNKHLPIESDDAIVVVEVRRWQLTLASDEALKEYAAAPYIAGLAAKLEGLVARPAELSRYHAIAEDTRPLL